ncbi:MAG: MoxR family ATPase [Lachnospiraceae bacterium]|nr:MoxR family ATPase [Lachnospiraceae bacterium]
MSDMTQQVISEVKKVIIGKDEVLTKIWMAILSQGHVLLEDVPGVGKTTMALSFSKVLGLEVRRIQFTPDTMPSDITGFSVFDQGRLTYQPGAVMTNILLADEINRTSAKTQSALLEAMEEGQVTIDGETHALPDPFVVLATQNPIGSAGTQLLPNSQLDRFLMKLSIGYPDHQSQISLMRDRQEGNPLDNLKPLMTLEALTALIDQVAGIFISDNVFDYIASLCEATREHPMVQLGVSPRASLALCRVSRARAFVEGRDYVLPEDVMAVVKDVFCHRLALSSKARLNDYTPELVMDEILASVPAPDMTEKTL